MKEILTLTAIAAIVFTANSGQTGDDAAPATFHKNSNHTTLLMHVVQPLTGRSDEDDNEDLCLSVILPVTIVTAGQAFSVTAQENYGAILTALHLLTIL